MVKQSDYIQILHTIRDLFGSSWFSFTDDEIQALFLLKKDAMEYKAICERFVVYPKWAEDNNGIGESNVNLEKLSEGISNICSMLDIKVYFMPVNRNSEEFLRFVYNGKIISKLILI